MVTNRAKRILVTGAGGNASQSFVSSLRMSKNPYFIVGTDANKFHLECSPIDARYICPPCSDPSYLDKLNRLIEKEKIDLVHPQPDSEVAFLAAHQDRVKAQLFLPSAESVRLCHDKLKTNESLNKADVPVPVSLPVDLIENIPSTLEHLYSQTNTEKIWIRAIRGAGSRAALPIKSARHATDWIHYWCSMKNLSPQDFMLAEYLPGKEFAFQSLWRDGKLVTSMARERLEYLFGSIMPSGQSSSPSIARTIHREDVNQVASKAVQAIDARPHGVYCVDLKENQKGVPCVTEINIGRFFTTSNFFSAAGSNMPDYYVRMALGENVSDLPPFNAVAADLYWIRGVDRLPTLIKGESWTSTQIP